MSELRQRLDLDPGNKDDDDAVEKTSTPVNDEDVVMTWLPLAFVAIAALILGSMFFFSSHDFAQGYFHMVHYKPPSPVHHNGHHSHVEMRLSKQELAMYNGIDKPQLYLAILGQVFDVTAGKRHYGQDGAYRYFIGVDRSRAFSSGQMNDGDDVSTLSNKELLSVHKWLTFFASHKNYIRIGTVEGLYYDRYGHVQPIMQTIRERIRDALLQAEAEAQVERCNMQWTAEAGATTVWCQDDEKYPRQYGEDKMCGCFTPSEISMQALPLYKNCNDKRCVLV
ncbi:unnamed protein product [Aphanomyces euteiches]|uniref:Cytochrome b5 heme-binding domain-containing protein n=1 Tax=Aphanomyces euteiches TaxID=100861 RepID=A0A6G0XS21_9STRA|nr:hypothetical protein Ae201684_001949 [Aphanomyces euteiches]KAH9086727.1 hypothetical protein Ae201684P_000149 [Aphanomyces euteiches]